MKILISIIALVCCILSLSLSEATETAKIATIFGKTGEASLTNLLYLQGVRFAVDELNEHGGLLDKSIELLEFDNQSTALGSKVAAQKAAAADVIAVIGPAWSSHSLAVAPVLQEAGIPMISPLSTHPDVTRVGEYIFRVCFLDSFQGKVMATFASQELNAQKAIVLTNTGNKYSMGLAEMFITQFTQEGGQILWEGDYLENVSDFKTLVEQVKSLQPDVVFLPGYHKDSAIIIAHARNIGITAPFLGGDGWNDLMYDVAGKVIEGNYYSSHWHPKTPTLKSQEFVTAYQARYGGIKENGVALSYDAVYILAEAIQRAHSFDPQQIREALANTTDFQGVTGNITFDQYGDPVKPAVILKFDQGTSVYVKTIEP